MIELLTITRVPSLSIPPPALSVAELLLMVELLTVKVPSASFQTAPPLKAVLFVSVMPFKVRMPSLAIAAAGD